MARMEGGQIGQIRKGIHVASKPYCILCTASGPEDENSETPSAVSLFQPPPLSSRPHLPRPSAPILHHPVMGIRTRCPRSQAVFYSHAHRRSLDAKQGEVPTSSNTSSMSLLSSPLPPISPTQQRPQVPTTLFTLHSSDILNPRSSYLSSRLAFSDTHEQFWDHQKR